MPVDMSGFESLESFEARVSKRHLEALRPEAPTAGKDSKDSSSKEIQRPTDFEFGNLEIGSASTSASSLAGFYFYFANGTELFIAGSTALADYNPESPDDHTDWSIVFPVSGGAIDTSGTITYDATTTLYDGDASADPAEAQTFYRLPLIRGVDFGDGLEPQTVSLGGVYRENIFCDASKGPIVELIKIA